MTSQAPSKKTFVKIIAVPWPFYCSLAQFQPSIVILFHDYSITIDKYPIIVFVSGRMSVHNIEEGYYDGFSNAAIV